MSVGALNASANLSVRELKSNVSPVRAQQATAKDGLDQIFVEGNDGKNYVAYGRSIEDAQMYQPGDDITLTTSDGRKVSGVVSFVDDEATSAAEGAAKPFQEASSWVAAAGAGAVGTISGFGVGVGGAFGAAMSGTAAVGMGAILGTAAAGGLIFGGIVGGGIAAYGAATAAFNHADESKIRALVK